MSKVAFITGITGQDGSYLCELLLEKEYIVHGMIRRSSSFNTHRIDHLYQNPQEENKKLILHYGDMTDSSCLNQLLQKIKPDEIYNLAAMSHVRVSFDCPEFTAEIDGLGTLRLLEAAINMKKPFKFYQAGTSELYGGIYNKPQNEETPFHPRSPYAAAKLYAYWIVKNYRDAYGIYAVNGILFNHTSPRRGSTFVEQKIVEGAVGIKNGTKECLYLGNLYSHRDFGHAKDFVYAMWLMLQQNKEDIQDYVIASGKKYMIKDLVNMVFDKLGMSLIWSGEGKDEIAILESTGKVVIRIDERYYRPTEVNSLHGDPSLAIKNLGWEHKYTMDSILDEMIEYQLFKDKK